jgi:hypothetical protein
MYTREWVVERGARDAGKGGVAARLAVSVRLSECV